MLGGRLAGLALLLLALPSAAARAEDPSPVPQDPWLTLDRELEQLELAQESGAGLEIGGYIKFSYRASDDLVYGLEPGTFQEKNDLGGFQFDSASLNFRGDVGDYSIKIAFNPVVSKLRSTYIRFSPTDHVRVTVGRFKVPLLRSRLLSTTRLLFLDRTIQARQTGPREEGAKLEIELAKDVELILAVQNGEDDQGDRQRLTARFDAGLVGGGVGKYEGAYKAGEPELTLGLAVSDDDGMRDGTILAADLAFTAGRFSLHAEGLHYDDGFGPYDTGLLDPFSIIPRADSTPLGMATSWMILKNQLELGARIEDFDDPNHTRQWTYGLNYYMEGHDAKWMLNWIDVETDNALLESDVIAFGVVVRI